MDAIPQGDVTTIGSPSLLQPGQIGPYRIMETIGEGGFGVVYLAEQSDPIRRRVALKVIKPGMDSKQIIARFEAEEQALALMDHPNVAKVLDAGVTGEGRPFFVMDYVPGVPITQYCDRQKLGIADRLRLFIKVCEAVQHAHQKGIIHRDIKPSNVLVTAMDGQATPKVIDFGVAKALSQRLTDRTVYTEQGQLIGTPEYMSPEQAEMASHDIDTRSDIYSLGVVLYELLTGALPFDSHTLRCASPAEIQRIIRDEEPPRPSVRTGIPGDESRVTAGTRSTDSKTLRRELHGDLDWITMKALDKDRTRRYPSASGLADDIRRHLRHEPVMASPPSAAYVLRKFIRRHKAGAITTAIVTVSLLAGVIGITWMALIASHQRQEALDAKHQADLARQAEGQQRQRAEREAAIAHAVNEFINEDLLAAVDPANTPDRDITMREVLDAASHGIEGRFLDAPLVHAAIQTTLGKTYGSLGDYDRAEEHLAVAMSLRKGWLGEDHTDTLQSMHDLAWAIHNRGRHEEAIELFLGTVDGRRRNLGEHHPDTLVSMNDLALVYIAQRRLGEAEHLHVETLSTRRDTLGGEHPDTVESMNNLGLLYDYQRRYSEAEPLLRAAVEARRRVLGDDHPDTLTAMGNLALLYSHQNRYEEAEPIHLRTLETRRRVLGDEHPHTLESMNNLALLYEQQGRHDEASELYARVLDLKSRVLGREHTSTLTSMTNLALFYRRQGSFDDAARLATEELNIRKRVQGLNHSDTVLAMGNLAVLYCDMERFDDAEPLLVSTVDRCREVLGQDHAGTVFYLNRLASLHRALGQPGEAALLYREILAIRQRTSPDKPLVISKALYQLGLSLIEQQESAEAETVLRECLQLRTAAHSDSHWVTAVTASVLGGCMVDQGKFEESETLLIAACERLRGDDTVPWHERRASLLRVVRLYERWNRIDQADAWRGVLAQEE